MDGAPTATLTAAVEKLAAVDVATLTDAELATDLLALPRLAAALQAAWLARLAAFDARGVAGVDGAASTAAWLRHRGRLTPTSARGQVRLARSLTALPQTAAALAAGELSTAHAAAVAGATAELSPEQVGTAEAILVPLARVTDPAAVERAGARLRASLEPDGALSATNAAHERRRLTVAATFGGTVVLDGVLDPEGGAALLAALTPLAAPAGPDDGRTGAQRRADALVELATRALGRGDLPACGGERAAVSVVVDWATLAGAPGAAEVGWVGPVPAETARRLACDAGVARVLTGPASEVLDVGRRTRVVSPGQRRALAVRDRGCRFPGCDRPPPWTDAHHLRPWADGGPSDMSNLILVCRAHHRALHEGGWRFAGVPSGDLVAVGPDGRRVVSPVGADGRLAAHGP